MDIGQKLLQPHSDKIVIWGMSCVGKTTLASLLINHEYICFDRLFPWHTIETLGLSIEASLNYIIDIIRSKDKYVIDGWHLSGGSLLPDDATLYVLHAPYENIIRQYRTPVADCLEHMPMYNKWYDPNYVNFGLPIRHFENTGDQFVEDFCRQ